jgi:hypothetical protein
MRGIRRRNRGRIFSIVGARETEEVKGGGVLVMRGDELRHARGWEPWRDRCGAKRRAIARRERATGVTRRGRGSGGRTSRCACHSRGGKRRDRCRENGGFIAVRACNGRDAREGGCRIRAERATCAGGSRGATVAGDARRLLAVQACKGRDAARAGGSSPFACNRGWSRSRGEWIGSRCCGVDQK